MRLDQSGQCHPAAEFEDLGAGAPAGPPAPPATRQRAPGRLSRPSPPRPAAPGPWSPPCQGQAGRRPSRALSACSPPCPPGAAISARCRGRAATVPPVPPGAGQAAPSRGGSRSTRASPGRMHESRFSPQPPAAPVGQITVSCPRHGHEASRLSQSTTLHSYLDTFRSHILQIAHPRIPCRDQAGPDGTGRGSWGVALPRILWFWLRRVQDDPFTEEGEASAAVHLAFDHLDLVDVSLHGAGVVGQGQAGGDGLLVASDAGGE